MRRTELAVGMEVYFADSTYAWKRGVENIRNCRATVVDLDKWAASWGGMKHHPAGRLVHIRTTSGFDDYVHPGLLRGPYVEIAATRRELQRGLTAHREVEERKHAERVRALESVIKEAEQLGLRTVSTAHRDRDMQYLELTGAELHSLLVEVREARTDRKDRP